jgi:PQQ-dependent catabolism-associated CXXCW motif protein
LEISEKPVLSEFVVRLTHRSSILIAAIALVLSGAPARAASYEALRAAKPDMFAATTGLRIDRQRAPTPDDIPPPARRADAGKARQLIADSAIAIDVLGAAQSRYDELDGTWLVNSQRQSLPGAIWLPEVGRGTLTDEMRAYFQDNLARLSEGDKTRPLLIFCVADCWMSWNAAQRAATFGYTNVHWFREGTDGWRDMGWELEPVDPVPVNVD